MIYIWYKLYYRDLALKNDIKLLSAAAIIVLIAACGAEKSEDAMGGTGVAPLLTAATLGEQTILTNSKYLSMAPYSSADRSNGEKLARVCRACHSFENNASNMIGPALFGVFGSGAGSRDGFEYSSVLNSADFVWTPRALDAWLRQPGRFLPGNRMVFSGLSRQSDRDDLIGYLLEVTMADDVN